MVIVEAAGESYHVDRLLWKNWEKINHGRLAKEDDDRVFVVDGRERTGKSVFAMQQAGAIDPKMFEEMLESKELTQICFTGEETLKAIRNTKSDKSRTRVVIFDEAFRGLASTSVLSKTNRMIVQALMEMGQNNIVLFIVLPSFFLLDRYPAALRSNALFHLTKAKGKIKRRKFYVYNFEKKAALFRTERKWAYSYPIHTRAHGAFFNKYPGGKEFEALYRRKKMKAFREIEKTVGGETEISKQQQQRNMLLWILYTQYKVSMREMSRFFKEHDIELTASTISTGVKNFKEYRKKILEDEKTNKQSVTKGV